MTDPSPDALVQAYLDRLRRLADVLPPDRRDDLVASVAEHLDAARERGREQGADDGVTVREALDRLGDPAATVAAAQDPTGRQPRSTTHELFAVLMLSVGSVIVPILGWIVGVALLWTSTLWRRSEKVLGTLVLPGGPLLFLVLLSLPFGDSSSCSGTVTSTSDGVVNDTTTCTGETFTLAVPLLYAGLLLLFLAPVAVDVVLYRRVRRRAALL